jgi:hypothetical protein
MKKLLFICVMAIAILLFSSTTVNYDYPLPGDGAKEPADNEVIFYEHTNFGGNSFWWYYDRDAAYLTSYNMGSTSKTWNDQISSIKVGKNACVTLWEHTNFKGAKVQLNGNGTGVREYKSMPSGWNDKASSLKIRMKDMCSDK